MVHTLPAMLRFRMFAIACGYEDADDCDALRTDPLFKLAVGRALVADETIRMALARCQQVDGRIGLKIDLATQPTTDVGNGGAKLVHGSGGIVSLRAEQNSAT